MKILNFGFKEEKKKISTSDHSISPSFYFYTYIFEKMFTKILMGNPGNA